MLRKSGDGARHLHAGRSAADHHEGEEAPPRLRLRGLLGLLEGGEDAAAYAGGVVDLLQPGCRAFPVVVTEVGMPRAGRDDELVVGNTAVLDQDDAPLLVDAVHLAQHDAHVGRVAQDGADRRSDLGRRQAGRRHLVEQRLEEVVVAPVDDRDVRIGAGEPQRGAEAAKARADNDDVRSGHGGAPLRRGRRD